MAEQRVRGYATAVPKLAQLGESVLFGDVWERPELSKRDRSLITIAALVALYRPQQLAAHIGIGQENGVQVEEIAEIITHLAFYAGWPCAVTAAEVLKNAIGQAAE